MVNERALQSALLLGLPGLEHGFERDRALAPTWIWRPHQVHGAVIVECREAGADMEFLNWRGFFGPPGLPAETAATYADLLKRMMETEAWATVRDRYGWVETYRPLDEFAAFLDKEEQQTKALLNSIGFQTVR
ncbi:MAG: hypothetical protein HC882_06320 [Acidobacteria bacterium]|nr:hypothetical protein [Acidobacteriota bacterium]